MATKQVGQIFFKKEKLSKSGHFSAYSFADKMKYDRYILLQKRGLHQQWSADH